MLNLHGSLFALRALVKPGLLVPGIKVDTIARLDFAALRKAGYTGAVFDRDNCLTIPHKDTLVPELAASPTSPHHMTSKIDYRMYRTPGLNANQPLDRKMF
ncbi:hypothetical protein FRC07_007826 [Ceratobasidium sp. 392]|nr:hypothetical protein FRC07_007826 [Ceratobasidium sp. 392]